MTAGTLAAALGRCLGKFEEAWGSTFDWRDSHDVQALAQLLVEEVGVATDREAARKVRELIRQWGNDG